MINKQGLWFLTLFSLILVLSIYYITMPKDVMTLNNGENTEELETDIKDNDNIKTEITSSNYLTSLKLELDTKREEMTKEYEEIINDISKTEDERNTAYEQLKNISNNKGLEEQAEKKLKEEYNLDSCIEIDKSDVTVTTISKTHDKKLANNIMKTIQSLFTAGMNVSVKFVDE